MPTGTYWCLLVPTGAYWYLLVLKSRTVESPRGDDPFFRNHLVHFFAVMHAASRVFFFFHEQNLRIFATVSIISVCVCFLRLASVTKLLPGIVPDMYYFAKMCVPKSGDSPHLESLLCCCMFGAVAFLFRVRGQAVLALAASCCGQRTSF